VAALLAQAAADGRLSADEHAERSGRAYAARTLGELAELTADLVEPSAQPIRLDAGRLVGAFFRTQRLDGRWVVPNGLAVTAMFGQVDLDLREALLQGQRITIRATLVCGTLRIIAPEGMAVEITGSTALPTKKVNVSGPAPGPGVPVVEIRTTGLGGRVRVVRPRRARWRRRPGGLSSRRS
jgi:hypothetical protein